MAESPNVGGSSNTLTGVAHAGPDRAWSVGYHRAGTARETLLLRWDGESWASSASPNPGALSNALLDVAADDDGAWAVGYKSGEEGYRVSRPAQ